MGKRLRLSLALVGLGAVIVSFAAYFHIEDGWWQPPYLVPAIKPAGIDFRTGLYKPAEALLHGEQLLVPYPPFTALLATPFLLLDIDRAYIVQVVLLYGLNILALWLAVDIAAAASAKADGPTPGGIQDWIKFPLFLVVTFLVVSSYGFLFSLERGNFDIYAMFAAVSGLWLVVKKPNQLWLQVACFSIAAQLKVYPAILFLLIVWKHGWKSIMPLFIINVLLLVSTGLSNAVQFFYLIRSFSEHPYLWQGNHSAASFAHMVNGYLGQRGLGSVPTLVFYLAPIGIWIVACVYLMKRGYSSIGAAWLFILSVPLMNVIPVTSHDYKLVLLGAPLAMSLLLLSVEYGRSGRGIRALQIALVAALSVVLAVSYTRLPVELGNKYPFILALQIVLSWALLTPSFARAPETDVLNAS